MGYMNEQFYKKAYMIEFIDKDNKLQEAFTFSVPPQSEDFDTPQRVTEIKTFGGTILETHGNDRQTIVLSGSSINQNLKKIYRSTLQEEYLTGEEELFRFKKIVEDNCDKGYDVYLYELVDNNQNLSHSSSKIWCGTIKDFKIRRSKEAPVTYFYTLEFWGWPAYSYNTSLPIKKNVDSLVTKAQPITSDKTPALLFTGGGSAVGLAGAFFVASGAEQIEALGIDVLADDNRSMFEKINDTITKCSNWIKDKTKFLETGLRYYSKGLSFVKNVNSIVDRIYGEIRSLSTLLNPYVNVTKSIINEGKQFINSIQGSGRFVLDFGLNIFNEAKELNSCAKDLVNYCRGLKDDFSKDGYFPPELLEMYNSTAEDIKNTWIETASEVEDNANEITKLAKLLNEQVATVVLPGTTGIDDQVVITYGTDIVSVSDGDSWDSLAQKYYGNPDLGRLLSSYNSTYNNLDDVTEIPIGTQIYIPKLSPDSGNNSKNEVYNKPNDKSPLGVDINNNLDLKSNDYVFVRDRENLSQAINNRLQTVLGANIRDEVYGIQHNIGSTDVTVNFILASIERTLTFEPRIKTVEKINFNTKNGNLIIDVDYIDIKGNKNSFSGRL